MKPSVTTIVSTLFLLVILRSIYSLFEIFQNSTCKPNEICYKSFLSTNPELDVFLFLSDNSKAGNYDLIFKKQKFDYSTNFERKISIELSKTVRNNGSLFVHMVITPSKSRRKESLEDISREHDATYLKNKLTKWTIPVSATFNLLKENNLRQRLKPVTHLRSRYAINMCTDQVEIPDSNIPREILRFLRINSKKQFLPIVQQDILQMRIKDLVEITPETKNINLTFIYTPISFGKTKFLAHIEATLYQFLAYGFTEKDIDEVKGVFADTNVYLLCATVFIGSIHLLLDFLSFKNDVKFWKSHSSMAGLSTRTVLWRAFSQTVVFLFLCDEGTSLLVLIPSGIATIIEFWKVSKVMKTRITLTGIKFEKNRQETEAEKKTREYDEECMNYLSYLLYPLCIGAAIYSLLYQPHKSWYSWTINSLVNGVYAFGFLFMLPQLFINYRLKSVAALPWRAFTYRAFNTFIDDIFAFIITMPMAHRVACFRDDVIFLIYLYQRWLYPVDKNRCEDPLQENNDRSEAIEKKKK